MEFDVHAFEGFLQVLHMAGGHRDVVGPQAQIILQPADVFGRHEARAQQAVRVERGDPLAVLEVGLATGEVFDVLAVDDEHFQFGLLQHFIGAEPVDAGGFHGHRRHGLLLEPVAQGVELAGGGAEHLRRVSGDGDVEGLAADINAGGLRVEDRQSLHRRGLSGTRLRRARSVLETDKPTQREHRTRGVAKQTKCRGPEPFSPTGSLRAPKGKAATLHPADEAKLTLSGSGAQIAAFRGPWNLSALTQIK